MDNQHRKIKGYKELGEAEIALMNLIKEKAAEVGALVDELSCRINHQDQANGISIDQRWVNIGKTDLQKGFMALTRAVAKPEFF